MQYLNLKYNKITGSIPESIGYLKNLIGLNLQHNILSNTIPTQMGLLSSLRYLALNSNYLTGKILNSFQNNIQLENLLLYDNELTGSIPDSLCNSNYLDVFLAFYRTDLYGLRGNTKFSCYPSCLSSVTNNGYADAYGGLTKCKLKNSIGKMI